MKRRRRPRQVKVKVSTEWMSADEATQYLRLPTARALYKLVSRRGVPAYRLGKRLLIFSKSELDAYIRANLLKPKPAPKRRPKPS